MLLAYQGNVHVGVIDIHYKLRKCNKHDGSWLFLFVNHT
jgi:hypothetical protein